MRGTPTAEITLGDHTLPVYAQRHAYLANRLGRFIDELVQRSQDLDANGIVGALQESSYELLCALVPNMEKRIPEYEYRGFSSREAMEAGDYDEQLDKSPTLPEIRAAFTIASKVNAFDVLTHLKGIIDPSLLRGVVNAQIAEAISQNSPSSLSENGASDLTTSGTTPPASTVNGA
jgi:hypothetical protein